MSATSTALATYYANLLILQYVGKAKAYATAQAITGLAVMPTTTSTLPLDVQGAFNLSTAIGVQLDILGEYAGVTRYGTDFFGNPITLSDSDFISLIQVATLKNSSVSSLSVVQSLLNTFFPGEILVFDYANMQMGYMISSSVGSQALAEVLVGEGILPKPIGVQLATTIYAANITNFFGFLTYDIQTGNAKPFNTYDLYSTTEPWLVYTDGVGIT